MTGIKKSTYSEQVADYIKQSILNQKLVPGDQIKEVVLSKELGISRAPIREALQILLREGLIRSEPQKGKYVTALTAKEIMDSYFTGGVLEAAAVTKAMKLYTEDDIAKLKEIVAQMLYFVTTDTVNNAFAELDSAFHSILFSRIDNELIVELCHRSCQRISKILLYKYWLNLFTSQEVYERHQEILIALKSGSASKLEKSLRKHYIDAGKRMSRYGVDVRQHNEPGSEKF